MYYISPPPPLKEKKMQKTKKIELNQKKIAQTQQKTNFNYLSRNWRKKMKKVVESEKLDGLISDKLFEACLSCEVTYW